MLSLTFLTFSIPPQILAVNGKSLLNLSYDQSLQILQNTDITVELTVSQIYKKPISSKQLSTVQQAKNSTVRNLTRSMKNSFKFRKDRKDVESSKANTINAHKINNTKENYHKTEDTCDTANWNCKNGNESYSNKVQSMPDLPKVNVL